MSRRLRTSAVRVVAEGRAKTWNPRTQRAVALRSLYLVEAPAVGRPTTRAECPDDSAPCPWVSCKWHLYVDVHPTTGSIKYNFPGLEAGELEETCAMRRAERGASTLEDIGAVLNVTRERARQMQDAALARLQGRLAGVGQG